MIDESEPEDGQDDDKNEGVWVCLPLNALKKFYETLKNESEKVTERCNKVILLREDGDSHG